MEYFLIAVLQIIGILLSVAQKVKSLDLKYPDKTKREILNIFLDEDWVTLFISGIVAVLDLITHFIIDRYTPDFRNGINYYILYSFALALILGYAGQRIVYKYLGKAEQVLDRQAEKIQ